MYIVVSVVAVFMCVWNEMSIILFYLIISAIHRLGYVPSGLKEQCDMEYILQAGICDFLVLSQSLLLYDGGQL